MSSKNKFKVVEGTHIEDGKKYTKGKIVESDRDLAKAFPLKFQKIGEAQNEPEVDAPRRGRPPKPENRTEPVIETE